MFYKRKGLPEEDDYVICIVTKILYHSIFVKLEEYQNQEGMIHISEISPGRIRNIRDFVKEGKMLVCKVLRVNEEKKHIDLSLRRVSNTIRKNKDAEYKQEQKAEKILEALANRQNTTIAQIYTDFGAKIIEKYGTLNQFFQKAVNNNYELNQDDVPAKYRDALKEIIAEKIKPVRIKLNSIVSLRSYAGNGVDIIKNSLISAKKYAESKNYELSILYTGAPKYRFTIMAESYKSAEKHLKELVDYTLEYLKQNQGEGELIN